MSTAEETLSIAGGSTSNRAEPPPSPSPDSKVIFFIRHAESQNNVAKRDAANVFRRWRHGHWSWPNATEWSSMTSLLAIPMDTDLSPDGIQQAQALQQQLQAQRFVESEGIQLIVHSHLIRARRTCHTVFAAHHLVSQLPSPSCPNDTPTSVESAVSAAVPIVQHDAIYEKSITEHVGTADLAQRTEAFVEWLRQRPETRLVVVGHSAFFRELLRGHTAPGGDDDGGGSVAKMDNCEVRRVELQPDGRFRATTTTVVAGGPALLSVDR
eukprot:gene10021-7163_t